MAHIPSPKLVEQIRSMVKDNEDFIIGADGIDGGVHIVVNDFDRGVWLCEHRGSIDMHSYARLQRLD